MRCKCNYPEALKCALEIDPYDDFFLSVEDFFKKRGYITNKQENALYSQIEILGADLSEVDLY